MAPTDCRDRRYDLAQLELVENGRLTGGIETDLALISAPLSSPLLPSHWTAETAEGVV
jgi:hypothetical protein